MKDSLHQLVKSLDKNEKRYFKLFAARHKSDSFYTKLFDAVDSQECYNDEKTCKILSDKINVSHLSSTKTKLYDLVLRSLDTYHLGLTVESQLSQQINQIKILERKGLFEHCSRLIAKAKKLAYSYEKHLFLLKLLDLEYALASYLQSTEDLETRLMKNHKEHLLVLEKYQNFISFKSESTKALSVVQKKGDQKDAFVSEELEKILNKPLFSKEENALSFQAKLFFYNIKAMYFNSKNDRGKFFENILKTTELWEQEKHQINENPLSYVVGYSNYLNACFQVNHLEEVKEKIIVLKDLENHFHLAEYLKIRVFGFATILEINVALAQRSYNEQFLKIPEIHRKLDEFGNKISERIRLNIYFHVAHVCFLSENYEDALFWLNKIFNETNKNINENLQCLARIINLLVHLELGNESVLSSAARSTYRYILQHEKLNPNVKTVLDFINKDLSKVISNNDLMNAMKKFHNELAENLKTFPDDYFADIVFWLEKKNSKN
ncbi:hypothetical protein IT568_04590 [bacterium]|nr:hypothetical protein [bacterium]